MCYTGISKNGNFFDLVILEFFGEALTARSGSDVKSRVQKFFQTIKIITLCFSLEPEQSVTINKQAKTCYKFIIALLCL